MKNKLFVLFSLLFICEDATCQISFSVQDSAVGTGRFDLKLAQVSVYKNQNLIGETNKFGSFTLEKPQKGDTITFYHPQYFPYDYVVVKKRLEEVYIPMKFNSEYIPVIDSNSSASFPGGNIGMKRWISTNFIYPREAIEQGITGKCWVQFTVEKDGSLSNIKVIRGVAYCPECDQEALRLFRMMPKWNPSMKDGEGVVSFWQVPLTFKFQ